MQSTGIQMSADANALLMSQNHEFLLSTAGAFASHHRLYECGNRERRAMGFFGIKSRDLYGFVPSHAISALVAAVAFLIHWVAAGILAFHSLLQSE